MRYMVDTGERLDVGDLVDQHSLVLFLLERPEIRATFLEDLRENRDRGGWMRDTSRAMTLAQTDPDDLEERIQVPLKSLLEYLELFIPATMRKRLGEEVMGGPELTLHIEEMNRRTEDNIRETRRVVDRVKRGGSRLQEAVRACMIKEREALPGFRRLQREARGRTGGRGGRGDH